MGIEFKFDDGGMKRWLREQASKVSNEAMDDEAAKIRRKVQAMACPRHGEHPTVEIERHTRRTALVRDIKARGFCCDEFGATVQAYVDSITDQSRKAA